MQRISCLAQLLELNGKLRSQRVLIIAKNSFNQKLLNAQLQNLRVNQLATTSTPAKRSLLINSIVNNENLDLVRKAERSFNSWKCVSLYQLGLVLWRNAKKVPKSDQASNYFERVSQRRILKNTFLSEAVPKRIARAIIRLANAVRMQVRIPDAVASEKDVVAAPFSNACWSKLYDATFKRLYLSESLRPLIIKSARSHLINCIQAAGGGRLFRLPWSTSCQQHAAMRKGHKFYQDALEMARISGIGDAEGFGVATTAKMFDVSSLWQPSNANRRDKAVDENARLWLSELDAVYLPLVHECQYPKFDVIVVQKVPSRPLWLQFYKKLLISEDAADIYVLKLDSKR